VSPYTPEQARLILDRLIDALTDDDATAQAFAEIAVAEAKRRAAGHPTPQARMAATGIVARAGSITGSAGTTVSGRGGSTSLGQVWMGAEFGSNRVAQFGPYRGRGAWLYPAATDDESVARLEREYIEPLIDRMI